ncbi:MAG TPA: HAD-IIB family hydrolase [bacterium]|nr:HAD-IIB family hydrolase [bacterium]
MTPESCLPIHRFPPSAARKLHYFFHDIDDTLSSGGRITSDAYAALWDLHQAGIRVVPVTGRPAGWCDHIARMWPVEAVIGENGAFYFAYDRTHRTMHRVFLQSDTDRRRGHHLLESLRDRVLREVPGSAVSADQPYRLADLAIDFCEDVEPLDPESIDAICRIAGELGLTWKVSSIHVNCWYGHFDKLTCLKHFLSRHCGSSLAEMQDTMVFIGDSPNDEPMFSEVLQSIAVANIRECLHRLTHHPAYITRAASGDGFREAVDTILSHRTG